MITKGLGAVVLALVAGCMSGNDPCATGKMEPGAYQLLLTGGSGMCEPVFSGLRSDGTVASLATSLCGSGCAPKDSCSIAWQNNYGTIDHTFLACGLTVEWDHGSGSCGGTFVMMGNVQTSCSVTLGLQRTGP